MVVGDEKTNTEPLPDAIITDELTNFLIAGTDTTGSALSFMFWDLAGLPEWQERLYKELDTVETVNGEFKHDKLINLPVLNSIINESLRYRTNTPSNLPRSVPKGGRVVEGIFLPEGVSPYCYSNLTFQTVVGVQGHTLHRDPSVFTNPDLYNPARWLDTKGGTEEMKEHFIPFSKGKRSCIGLNLALVELRLTTATVVKKFKVARSPEAREDEADMTDQFVLMPKAGKLRIVLTSRQEI
jgi:cytochrome P450